LSQKRSPVNVGQSAMRLSSPKSSSAYSIAPPLPHENHANVVAAFRVPKQDGTSRSSTLSLPLRIHHDVFDINRYDVPFTLNQTRSPYYPARYVHRSSSSKK
jgi:hypothetical protein